MAKKEEDREGRNERKGETGEKNQEAPLIHITLESNCIRPFPATLQVEKRREDTQRIQQATREKDRRAREKREKREVGCPEMRSILGQLDILGTRLCSQADTRTGESVLSLV